MRSILSLATLLLAPVAVLAQPTVQISHTQADIDVLDGNATAGAGTIADGDATMIAVDASQTTPRIVFFNGSDTDDSDGDAIVRVTPGSTGGTVLATGNDLEAAIATVGGTLTNAPIRGMAVDGAGNVFTVVDGNGDSAAYLIRTSVAGGSSVVIAGGNSGTSVVDGTVDIEVIGTTVYLLQRASFSASADQILAFDGAGAAGITAAATQTISLASAFGASQAPSAIARRGTNLIVLDSGAAGTSDSIGLITLPAGTFSVLKAGTAIVADLTGSGLTDMGYATGAIAVDSTNNDIYLQVDGDFATPAVAGGDFLVRIDGTTNTASVFITQAQTAAALPTLGTGAFYNNSFSLAVWSTSASERWVYVTNDNSGGDGIFRVQAPTAATAAGESWALYN